MSNQLLLETHPNLCNSLPFYTCLVILWITPEQITHRSFMRHILVPVETLDLVDIFNCRGETSMSTIYLFVRFWIVQYLLLYYGIQREVAKDICEVLPNQLIAIFSETLIVEAINLIDFPVFMVAYAMKTIVTSEDSDSILIAYLQAEDQREGLNRLGPSVNVVSHKQVVSVLFVLETGVLRVFFLLFWTTRWGHETVHECLRKSSLGLSPRLRLPHHWGFL